MASNQVQFSEHAVERVFGRLSSVVTYGEVQNVLINKPLRNGFNRVPVKRLAHKARIFDDTAFNKKVEGDKVFANVQVSNGNEVEVITIALSY